MRRKLGEILVTAGFVTNEDIQLALTDQSAGEPARLGDLLVALGKITPLQLARALSTQYAIPYLDLPVVPQSVMEVVPLDFQRQYRFLPIKVEPGVITIAMADLSQLVTDVLPTLKRQHPSVKVFVAAGDEIDAVHAALSGQYDTAPASSLPAIAPAIAPVSSAAPVAELDLFASFELDPPPPGPPQPTDEIEVDVSTSGIVAPPRGRVEEEEPTFFEASLAPIAPSAPSPAPPSIAPVIRSVAPAIPAIAPVSARPPTGKLPPPPPVRPVTSKLPPLPPVTHGAPPPPPGELPVPQLLPPPPPVTSSPSFPDLLVEAPAPAAARPGPPPPPAPSLVMMSEAAVSVSSVLLSPSAVFEADAPPPPPGHVVAESAVDDFFSTPLGASAPAAPEFASAAPYEVADVEAAPGASYEVADVEVEPAPGASFEVADGEVEPARGESFEVADVEVEPAPGVPYEVSDVEPLQADSFDLSAVESLPAEPEGDLPFFESSSPSQAVGPVLDDAFVPGVPSSSPSSLAQLMIEPEAPVAPMHALELPRVAPVVAPVPPPPAIRSALVPPPPPAPSVPPAKLVEALVEPEAPPSAGAPGAAELPDWLKGSSTQEVAEVGWTGALDHLAPSKLILAVTRALIRRGLLSERDILDAVDKKK